MNPQPINVEPSSYPPMHAPAGGVPECRTPLGRARAQNFANTAQIRTAFVAPCSAATPPAAAASVSE